MQFYKFFGITLSMTRVHNITLEHVLTPEDHSTSSDTNADAARRVLQLDKEVNILQSQIRMETFKDILCDNPFEWKSWQYALTGFGGIIFAVISTSLYTLIPAHNVIEHPHYWYEAPLVWMLTFHPIQVLLWMYRCSFYTNTSFLKAYRHFWAVYIVVAITWMIGFGIASMPSNGHITTTAVPLQTTSPNCLVSSVSL